MSIIEQMNLILTFLCAPIDFVFSWFFGFVPDILKTICVSMLILTIGKILNFYERKTYQIIKILLYLWFFLYTLYTLDFLSGINNYDPLDWTSLLFSIFAPICLIIVGILIKNRFKSIFHFDLYYLIMILYLILGGLWFGLRPEDINFSMYVLYWSFLVLCVYLFSHINKGVLSVQSHGYNFWKNLKVLLKLAFGMVIYHIVLIFLIPLNPQTIIENWQIGIFGVIIFSLFTILYYKQSINGVFITLMFGCLSFLINDLYDFLIFISSVPGIILLFLTLLFSTILLVHFQKRAYHIAELLVITIVYTIIFLFLFSLNNEKIVENWVLGLFFTFLFSVLYLLPPGKLWLIIKKFHLFMVIFWICWFLADYEDFIRTILIIY